MEEVLDVLLRVAGEIFKAEPRVCLWLGGSVAALAALVGLALWLFPRPLIAPLLTGILGVLVLVAYRDGVVAAHSTPGGLICLAGAISSGHARQPPMTREDSVDGKEPP